MNSQGVRLFPRQAARGRPRAAGPVPRSEVQESFQFPADKERNGRSIKINDAVVSTIRGKRYCRGNIKRFAETGFLAFKEVRDDKQAEFSARAGVSGSDSPSDEAVIVDEIFEPARPSSANDSN